MRARYAPDDWDSAATAGTVDVAPLPRGDAHVLVVSTTAGRDLCLLVVPPSLTPGQGAEAMLAASTPGYPYSAASLLDTVRDHVEEPARPWTDSGDTFWSSAEAPSWQDASPSED